MPLAVIPAQAGIQSIQLNSRSEAKVVNVDTSCTRAALGGLDSHIRGNDVKLQLGPDY
ncbi:hypothetical protein [Calycomorphotria hydatis]|uniref:Uncharacterized protein n=1 Tax=Calycomorphotria hydatis TaxID=2528027 RepID=A0A517T3Q6_9PLAN|nr:hypothetical protein [Calycomorphotria hydatis]QDT63004.1 hypothetical protein V22_02020 [Calycomorphotria hydatis]